MAVVLAIDAGTTGVRTLAVDEHGAVVASSYRELAQHYPRPGEVEHDPDEIWAAVSGTLAAVATGLDAPVAALGITNQRETVVAWDRRTGRPRHRAVVWQDRRTAGRCRQLQDAGHLPLVRDTTGLVLDPYFSASKIEWLLGPGGVEADAHLALGTVDSWILWNLTGGRSHATDPSNASRTMLFDIRRQEWSPELCDMFGVPEAALPEVLPSSGRFAVLAAGPVAGGPVAGVPVAGVPGAGVPVAGLAGVPVSGIAGDQQAALFGQACFVPGMAKNTYGTGSFVLVNAGETCPGPAEGLLTTVAWTLGGAPPVYALEGAVFATGAAVSWLRDGLGIIAGAGEVEALAASVRDTEGVYLVPAFTGLGSPWWDPWARGTIVGLTRGVGRGHLARAALEAMAFQTRDVVDAMAAATGRPVSGLRVDGGASVNDLMLQFQADQLQAPVARSAATETTALGAAFLAGLAEGVWSSTDEVAACWRLDAELEPRSPRSVADRRQEQWRRAVHRSRGWAQGSDG